VIDLEFERIAHNGSEFYNLYCEDKEEEAIDWIFEIFDDLFLEEKFKEADKLLFYIKRHFLHKLSSNMIVGLLSITLAAKDKMGYRFAFVLEARDAITKYLGEEYGSERVNKIMNGLT